LLAEDLSQRSADNETFDSTFTYKNNL
jgi:hypothetical protein